MRETVAHIIEKLDDADESEEMADVEQEMEDDRAEQAGPASEGKKHFQGSDGRQLSTLLWCKPMSSRSLGGQNMTLFPSRFWR